MGGEWNLPAANDRIVKLEAENKELLGKLAQLEGRVRDDCPYPDYGDKECPKDCITFAERRSEEDRIRACPLFKS